MTLSCETQTTYLALLALVEVTYELFGPTARPGFSHSRKTLRPGNERGIERFWEMEAVHEKPSVELKRQDWSCGTSLEGAAGPQPVVSFKPVWLAFHLALFG